MLSASESKPEVELRLRVCAVKVGLCGIWLCGRGARRVQQQRINVFETQVSQTTGMCAIRVSAKHALLHLLLRSGSYEGVPGEDL